MRGSQALGIESCAERLCLGGFLKCRKYQLSAGQYLATCSLRDKSLGVQPDKIAQERTNSHKLSLDLYIHAMAYITTYTYTHTHRHTHIYIDTQLSHTMCLPIPQV